MPELSQQEKDLALLFDRLAYSSESRAVKLIDDRKDESESFDEAVRRNLRDTARSDAVTKFLIPFLICRARDHGYLQTAAVARDQAGLSNYLKGCGDEAFALVAFLRLCAGQGSGDAPPVENTDVGQG